MTVQFVPQHEFCPVDHHTLRRRLQTNLGIEKLSDESDSRLHFVDLRSGVRLVADRRFRRVTTSPNLPKALTFIHILATIAEGGPLHNSLFRREERISLLGLEHLMNAAVRTGLWKVAGYGVRVHSGEWGPNGMSYCIDLQEWNKNVDSDLQCENLTVRQA
jgi:hypothetical protein